jgi:hypothetical protein
MLLLKQLVFFTVFLVKKGIDTKAQKHKDFTKGLLQIINQCRLAIVFLGISFRQYFDTLSNQLKVQ